MKTRKILLAVLALCLLSAVTVTGTLAVFSMKAANPVTNTFVSNTPSLLRGQNKAFTLTESLVTWDGGDWELDESVRVPNSEVPYNKYYIPLDQGTYLPGPIRQQPIPKDAVVCIDGRTDTPAYLYVEIVLHNYDDVWIDAMLANHWKPMMNTVLLSGGVFLSELNGLYAGYPLLGPHGGYVFVYDNYDGLTSSESYTISVFDEDEVLFNYVSSRVTSFDIGMDIYAYLVEADSSNSYPEADCFHRAFGFENFEYEDD